MYAHSTTHHVRLLATRQAVSLRFTRSPAHLSSSSPSSSLCDVPFSPFICCIDANRATSPASAYGSESSGPYSSNLPKPAETPNVKAVSKVPQHTKETGTVNKPDSTVSQEVELSRYARAPGPRNPTALRYPLVSLRVLCPRPGLLQGMKLGAPSKASSMLDSLAKVHISSHPPTHLIPRSLSSLSLSACPFVCPA